MVQKCIGAGCVFFACGLAGFRAAASLRKEEQMLLQTRRMLEKMESELSCRVTTLPQLCLCASGCGKQLEELYRNLSQCLEQQVFPDATGCMEAVLTQAKLPETVAQLHRILGQTLGRFDLSGQLEELAAVKTACQDALDGLRQNVSRKSRTYQTLGLCAGAALAIMLL